MANLPTNIYKEKKENMEKRKYELQAMIEKQDDRINHLQTSAFELANYYFVFQGIILGAIVNATSLLRCQDRWFLFSLSLIAAILNLVSLLVIGANYKRNVMERSQTKSERNELVSDLARLDTSPSDHRLQTNILSYWIQASELEFASTAAPTQHEKVASQDPTSVEIEDEPEQRQSTRVMSRHGSVDNDKKRLHDFYSILCMGLFVTFSIIVVVGSWTIPCKKALQCTPPISNANSHKCMKLCEGAKCISICS